jgi:hypothetical protein
MWQPFGNFTFTSLNIFIHSISVEVEWKKMSKAGVTIPSKLRQLHLSHLPNPRHYWNKQRNCSVISLSFIWFLQFLRRTKEISNHMKRCIKIFNLKLWLIGTDLEEPLLFGGISLLQRLPMHWHSSTSLRPTSLELEQPTLRETPQEKLKSPVSTERQF